MTDVRPLHVLDDPQEVGQSPSAIVFPKFVGQSELLTGRQESVDVRRRVLGLGDPGTGFPKVVLDLCGVQNDLFGVHKAHAAGKGLGLR